MKKSMKLRKVMRCQVSKYKEDSFMSMFPCIQCKPKAQEKQLIPRTVIKSVMEVNIRCSQEERTMLKVDRYHMAIRALLKPFKVVMMLM